MKLSVIVSTYNSPQWLEKVLWGYSAQKHRDFELVIADDGSTADTAQLIRCMVAETGMVIEHVWQRDDGFRKCRILNKAVLAANHDYLVFSDGDCIPRADFLAEHARCAEPGYFLSGSYCKLPMVTSEAITKDDILSGRCFDIAWLRAHGLPRNRKNLKLAAPPKRAGLLNRLTTARCNFKGSNASVWKADVLRVNGFDERMQYGGLDREIGVRLVNAGVRPKHARYNAVVLHLDHPRGYKDAEMVASNRALRLHNQRHSIARTEHGIAQLLES